MVKKMVAAIVLAVAMALSAPVAAQAATGTTSTQCVGVRNLYTWKEVKPWKYDSHVWVGRWHTLVLVRCGNRYKVVESTSNTWFPTSPPWWAR